MHGRLVSRAIGDLCAVPPPAGCTNGCSETDCFEAVYIQSALTKGYHFDTEEKYKGISFVENIGGEEASWALGLMTVETRNIEEAKGDRSLSKLGMVLMVVFGTLMVALASLALYFFNKIHNNRVLNKHPTL